MGDGPNDVGASRYHIMNAVEASLRRLRTDHIDLYQIHAWDESVPVAEMMRALDDLVRAGKIRYIGTSQFSAWQLAHCNTFAEMMGWEHFVTIQTHYNMFERDAERELLPYCAWSNVGVLPYFPLASGVLTGKVRRGERPPEGSRLSLSYFQAALTDANLERVERIVAAPNLTVNRLAVLGRKLPADR